MKRKKLKRVEVGVIANIAISDMGRSRREGGTSAAAQQADQTLHLAATWRVRNAIIN
jgi:hypothetical protein